MSGKPVRRAGSPWRVLAWKLKGREATEAVNVSDPSTEFDELCVGRWLHVEQMDSGRWWMNVGGVTLWVEADRDGRPKLVPVFGPKDYDQPAEGCKYELTWRASPSSAPSP
mgnify:CR=1 FL=1